MGSVSPQNNKNKVILAYNLYPLYPLLLFAIFRQKKTWKRGFCTETQSYPGFVDPRLCSRLPFTHGEIPGCSMA